MPVFDIYVRVSEVGDRGGDRFGSPEEQEAACRQFAATRDWEVDEVIYEANVSGSTPVDERDLGRLIRKCEAGESAGILCRHIDRFGRSMVEGMLAYKRLEACGARLVAVADGLDSSDPGAKTLLGFRLVMAEDVYDRNRAARIAGKKRAAERGVYGARAPYGYVRDDDGRLVPNDDEAQVVREVYRLRAEGVGYSDITRRFNLPSRGTPRNIIQSRVYLGESRIPRMNGGEPEVISGSHMPLVTEAEWQAANAVQGRAPIRRGLAEQVQLKNIAVCGICGRYLSVNAYGRNRDRLTYVCTRKGCGRVALAAITLEPLVFEKVSAAVLADEPHVVAILNDDERYNRALAEVEQAQQVLAAYRDDVRIQATLGLEDFAAGLAARREALELARRQLRETPRPDGLTVNVTPFDLNNLSAEYIAHQATLTRRVVQEVRVYPRTAENRITLRWRGSVEQLPLPISTEARAA